MAITLDEIIEAAMPACVDTSAIHAKYQAIWDAYKNTEFKKPMFEIDNLFGDKICKFIDAAFLAGYKVGRNPGALIEACIAGAAAKEMTSERSMIKLWTDLAEATEVDDRVKASKAARSIFDDDQEWRSANTSWCETCYAWTLTIDGECAAHDPELTATAAKRRARVERAARTGKVSNE